MKESLYKRFQKIQKSKNELLRSLDQLSEEQLNTLGEENKWSIAQITYHIYLAESLSLEYMKKKSQGLKQLQSGGLKESLKSLMLKIALKLPIKYKAPKIISQSIPEEIEWKELLIDWGNNRDELYKFIEQLPEEALQLNIFKHPKIGLINLKQTLEFYNEHFEHHLPQINNHLSKFKSAQ